MGTSTSWIAVAGADLVQVARDLGLAPAPPDWSGGESTYQVATLPSGWVLLVRRMERDGVVADRALLETLSRGRRVVGCDEESHVMYSASSEWRDGRELWAVIHASEQASDHLVERGDLPPNALAVKTEWTSKHAGDADVDYVYEIPLEVARLVVDYRMAEDDDDLELVALVAAPPRPWWKIW